MTLAASPRSLKFSAVSIGAQALGALALGALAIGALAIGRLAIRRMAIRGIAVHAGRVRSLQIGDLSVRRLRVHESSGDLRGRHEHAAGPASVSVRLDRTLVPARDAHASATFFAEVFGLPAPVAAGPLQMVRFDDGTSFEFMQVDGEIPVQRYTFVVDPAKFDAIATRVRAREPVLLGNAVPALTDDEGPRCVQGADRDGHRLEIVERTAVAAR